MPTWSADDIAAVLKQEQLQFAELLGTLHTMRFTGAVVVKFLNGEPQQAELGRPHVITFPRPGARDHREPRDRQAPIPKSLDSRTD